MDKALDMSAPSAPGYGYDQPQDPPGYSSFGSAPAPVATQPQPQVVYNNTTIVQPQQVAVNMPRSFSTGVCACCDDMEICCCGTFCPCILGCRVADAMNESCCVPNCLAAGLMGLRIKVRMQYNIGGTICNDWCTTVGCTAPCALCQIARELRANGAM